MRPDASLNGAVAFGGSRHCSAMLAVRLRLPLLDS